MDFILVGNDETARKVVRGAQQQGHRLVAYWNTEPQRPGVNEFPGAVAISSWEEVSSFGAIDFLLMSGNVDRRADRLRAIFRTEPFDMMLCVPQSDKPDVYYELALWQTENETRILPLMPELFHPGLGKLLEKIPRPGDAQLTDAGPAVGIEMRLPLSEDEQFRFLDGWTWLRSLGGEIGSITAISSAEEPQKASEIVASARFENHRLANIHWIAGRKSVGIKVQWDNELVECDLPDGFDGPAEIRQTKDGQVDSETIPGAPVVDRWLEAWNRRKSIGSLARLTEATRQVELAAAMRRSLKYNRAVSLEYDEFSEEASFKGIMATMGCGLLWGIMLVAILGVMGVPYIHYLVLPALVLFLVLQLFGLVFKTDSQAKAEGA